MNNLKKFDIFNMSNPYTFYEWARKEKPIFWDNDSKYWVITRYKDVKEILLNHTDFSAEAERFNYSNICPAAQDILRPVNFHELFGLSTTENPNHDRVKNVLMPIFGNLLINELKPKMEQIISGYIDKLSKGREIEIISEVFHELPAEIIFTLLGIPKKDVGKIKKWSESRLELTWGPEADQVKNSINTIKYWRYTQDLIQAKMKNPKNDLPSRLLEHFYTKELTLKDIELLCYGLIFSGHTTTTTFLAESLKTLLETNMYEAFIKKGTHFKSTFNELLRLCPSAITRRRKVLRDVQLDGITLKKDSVILISLGSANRDEEIFRNPNEIMIERPQTKNSINLSLGAGFHYCIGAKLVRMEYSIIMDQLSRKFPNMKLVPGQSFIYHKNISIRALQELHVQLN